MRFNAVLFAAALSAANVCAPSFADDAPKTEGAAVRTHIAEGTKAPAFEALDTNGKTVKSSDLIGKTPFVLYFYPKDDTPGCTIEGCAFRDESADYTKAGVAVYGVSLDSVESHKAFSDKNKFTFPLLSDPDQKICAAYGVTVKDNKYPERVTFAVDKEGTVKKVFPKVVPNGHAKEVLAVLHP